MTVIVQNAFMLHFQSKLANELHAPENHPKPHSQQSQSILGIAIIQISRPRKIEKEKQRYGSKNSYADKTRAHRPGSFSIKFKMVLVKLVGSRFVTL